MTPNINAKSGKIYLPRDIGKVWTTKIPQKAHRLSGSGTCSFARSDYFKFMESDQKGILYIDVSKKLYVHVPMNVIRKYTPTWKDYYTQADAFAVLPIKQMMNENNIKPAKIPIENEVLPGTLEADEIRRKFGLK